MPQALQAVPNPYTLEDRDIQGNILRPYAMDHALYVFLTFRSAVKAKRWLARLADNLTSASDWGEQKPAFTLNFALSFQGLKALGLSQDLLESFPEEFRLGMKGRSAVLGDNGGNARENWDKELQDPELLHGLLMIHAQSERGLDAGEKQCLPSEGVEVRYRQQAATIKRDGALFEHFGFVDGISQPSITGDTAKSYPGQGTWDSKTQQWKSLAPGCFVLGYADEFNQVAILPKKFALRNNGTYLVVRKLEQHVFQFREYTREKGRVLGWEEEKMAAKLMGRWRSGAPLSLCPDKDDPELARDPERNNDFLYEQARREGEQADPYGHRCPVGAHVRRANPRDSSLTHYAFSHRMIRRSMPYGPELPTAAKEDDKQRRGLMFLAYNTSIAQQFEMVQQQWLNSGNLTGSLSSAKDPVSPGNVCPFSAKGEKVPGENVPNQFTVPQSRPNSGLASHTFFGVPDFVSVKGGEYFFVPGIKAIKYIASTVADDTPQVEPVKSGSFLQEYFALQLQIPEPQELLQKQRELLEQRILLPKDGKQDPRLWKELREQAPIFATPHGVLVASFNETRAVLGLNEIFSVHEYGSRMQLTTGPFFLGYDDTPRYRRESSIARQVIRRDDEQRIREFTKHIALLLIRQVQKEKQRLDVTSLAMAVLLRVIGNYYGMVGPNDPTMRQWFTMMSAYIFLPEVNTAMSNTATQLGAQVQAYLDGIITARRAQMLEQQLRQDDVLQRLLELRDEKGQPLDQVFIRRELAGMVSGSLVAPAGMLGTAFSRFVASSAEDRAVVLEAVQTSNNELLSRFILEAARFEPTPALLYRYTRHNYTLGLSTPKRAPVPVPEDTRVVCGLASAMADEQVIDKPSEFWFGQGPDRQRPDWAYLNFGYGQHVCLGRRIGMAILTELFKQVLRLPEPRVAQGEVGRPERAEIQLPPGITEPERLVIEYKDWQRGGDSLS